VTVGRRPSRSARRGFTLIEVIVVFVVLGVVSGLVAPRIMSNERRRAAQTVRAIDAMLTVIAERDTFGQHRMALRHDPASRTLRLDVLRQAGSSDRRGRLADAVWRPDPLTPEVSLGRLRLAETRLDGRPPVDDAWSVEFVPGIPRPLIELIVELDTDDPSGPAWLIELLPYAPSADVAPVSSAGAVRGRGARSVDLDEMGKSDVPW
jgi:prepilin-type N-terminal cleavage/methylation domain-containing protein